LEKYATPDTTIATDTAVLVDDLEADPEALEAVPGHLGWAAGDL
jgi:hypothetical protein